MSSELKTRLAVIHGDPSGIGPELIAKLLAEDDIQARADILLVGDRHVFALGFAQAGHDHLLRTVTADVPENWFDGDGFPILELQTITPEEVALAEVTEAGGRSSLRGLDKAIDLTLAGLTDAVLFGPFNKAAMHLAGMGVEDEHRYIAKYIGFDGHHSEINMLDELITTRVTSHIGLKDVVKNISGDAVLEAIQLANDTLRKAGNDRPRIGVAALNPHAGDNGNFGREEIDILTPAIERAQKMQMDVSGPWPSDTVFLRGRDGRLDAVVTMYHDQGQIAMKLMGFDRGVTIAAGLPIPVATPAHGTAFDIAGQGVANLGATRNAFDVLCRMGLHHRQSMIRSNENESAAQ